MANRSTSIGRLTRRAPELARIRVMRAIADARGNLCATSRILGISLDQVTRYVRRFQLTKHLGEVRRKHRWVSGIYEDGSNDTLVDASTRVDAWAR
jgi:transposase-like protein